MAIHSGEFRILKGAIEFPNLLSMPVPIWSPESGCDTLLAPRDGVIGTRSDRIECWGHFGFEINWTGA